MQAIHWLCVQALHPRPGEPPISAKTPQRGDMQRRTPGPDTTAPAVMECVFALWDRMAMREAAGADRALLGLLEGLCDLLASQSAVCMVAARMPHLDGHDPVQDWRPCHVAHLHPSAQARANATQVVHSHGYRKPDITVINNVAGAGAWRAKRLCELAPAEWFKSPYYGQFYTRLGRSDAIWVGCPITEDIEVYIGIYRSTGQPPFQSTEADTALFALRGLGWFLQRYLFSLGLDLARTPLTDTERTVLHRLLGGQAPRDIADELSQSVHTCREHIQAIYKKYNVKSRAQLMALWLA